MNGHDVPLSGPVATSSGPAFKATILRAWFVGGQTQALEFSRGARPVKIWEVRLIDPTYSVADYLAFLKQARPDLSFGNAWWETGWVRFALCAGAGGVLLAVFAPWVVLLFIGPQGRTRDFDYDLDRFKGGPAEQPPASATDAELDLSSLEAQVAEGSAPGAATPPSQAVAPSPPPKLGGEPDRLPLIEADNEPEEYAGEFYPVARHSSHKHDHETH
jgi:hypothetical protein